MQRIVVAALTVPALAIWWQHMEAFRRATTSTAVQQRVFGITATVPVRHIISVNGAARLTRPALGIMYRCGHGRHISVSLDCVPAFARMVRILPKCTLPR